MVYWRVVIFFRAGRCRHLRLLASRPRSVAFLLFVRHNNRLGPSSDAVGVTALAAAVAVAAAGLAAAAVAAAARARTISVSRLIFFLLLFVDALLLLVRFFVRVGAVQRVALQRVV